jgi:hypothetical protein
VDGDGWEVLVIANGHVLRDALGRSLPQLPVLRNQGTGRFQDITGQEGSYFRAAHLGRGLPVEDLDNDGRPDLVISHLNEPVVLLHNVSGEGEPRHHWLGVALVARENWDKVGVRVVLQADGQRQTRFVKGGGSYLSSSDPRHLFGLGKAERVEHLRVHWPSGSVHRWEGRDLPVDRYWVLVQEMGVVCMTVGFETSGQANRRLFLAALQGLAPLAQAIIRPCGVIPPPNP